MPVLDDTLADMASMMGGSAKVEMTPPLRRDPALAMKDDTAAFVVRGSWSVRTKFEFASLVPGLILGVRPRSVSMAQSS